MTLNDIDWSRIAEPQADQYDSKITFASACCSVFRAQPNGFVPRPLTSAVTCFDNTVAIGYLRDEPPGAPKVRNGSIDHPNIPKAASLIKSWPEAYRQFQLLMHTLHPLDVASGEQLYGSISHSDEGHFGTMFGSVFDPIGLAEACVHELAHNKLRALGIGNTGASCLIRNAQDKLYPSPVKRVGLRPMSAVLHAEYSFVYVTELQIRMLSSHPPEQDRLRLKKGLHKNLSKIELGWQVIDDHCQVDRFGSAFIQGLRNWIIRLVTDGRQMIN